jgi:O-acetyl-ADP-ribose deacetylase (regulator of RNase III)
MGKGLALQFKEEFDEAITHEYKMACTKGTLRPGRPQFLRVYGKNTRSGTHIYAVINFPTKLHWRDPSRIEWIETGLVSLAQIIKSRNLESIAIPRLGCGLGGLNWADVRPLIEKYLGDINCRVVVYE